MCQIRKLAILRGNDRRNCRDLNKTCSSFLIDSRTSANCQNSDHKTSKTSKLRVAECCDHLRFQFICSSKVSLLECRHSAPMHTSDVFHILEDPSLSIQATINSAIA